MSKVFSEVDSRLRRCRKDEIGMSWEDRWSIEDFVDGFCDDDQVGQPKVEPEAEPLAPDPLPSTPAEPFRPLTKAERKQLLQEMTDKLLIKAHADPLAFADDASTQLNKLLDLAGKQDAGAVDVRQISIERFTELSLEDKDAALVDTLLLFVPEDARSSALERLGIDAPTWDTMQGVRALQARINVLEGEKPT